MLLSLQHLLLSEVTAYFGKAVCVCHQSTEHGPVNHLLCVTPGPGAQKVLRKYVETGLLPGQGRSTVPSVPSCSEPSRVLLVFWPRSGRTMHGGRALSSLSECFLFLTRNAALMVQSCLRLF